MQRYTYKNAQNLDDLISDEPMKRLTAAENILDVAKDLGKDRCKSLILFLRDIMDGEEEFLAMIAVNLKGLINYLGPESILSTFPIMTILFSSEDKSVRESVGRI
jgi:hypothetical protein